MRLASNFLSRLNRFLDFADTGTVLACDDFSL
jgi:hypothetical protein